VFSNKTVLVGQALISFMMALLMTGFFSFLELGPTAVWLDMWWRSFVAAWPVAFCLSVPVSKLAFTVAIRLTTGAAR